MGNIQKFLLGLAVLVVGALYLFIGGTPAEEAPDQGGLIHNLQEKFTQGLCIGETDQLCYNKSGAITSSSFNITGTTTITSDYYTIGGVDYASVQMDFQTATRTSCSIPNPWLGQATSTLLNFIVQATTGTSSAVTFDVATSTNITGTSTPAFIYAAASASGAIFTKVWTPLSATTSAASPNLITSNFSTGESGAVIGKNEYVNMTSAGSGSGGYPAGSCSALFMKP